jgi:K+ transporter
VVISAIVIAIQAMTSSAFSIAVAAIDLVYVNFRTNVI